LNVSCWSFANASPGAPNAASMSAGCFVSRVCRRVPSSIKGC
jgi:hypothetical protein